MARPVAGDVDTIPSRGLRDRVRYMSARMLGTSCLSASVGRGILVLGGRLGGILSQPTCIDLEHLRLEGGDRMLPHRRGGADHRRSGSQHRRGAVGGLSCSPIGDRTQRISEHIALTHVHLDHAGATGRSLPGSSRTLPCMSMRMVRLTWWIRSGSSRARAGRSEMHTTAFGVR